MKLRHTQIKENAAKTKARIEKAVKETEGKVPGLTIELEGVDEVVNRDTKMKAEFASGQPPEIFELFGGTDTKNYAKTGKLLDLTPIIEELGLKDKFYNLSEFTVDGNIYGLPRAGFVEGIFYNKKIFADNGLEVPRTWKEFEDLCQKLKEKGITPFALGAAEGWVINMMPNTLWVCTAGVDIVENIAAGKAKWNDPDVVKGFQIFDDLLKKEYFTKNAIGLKYDAMQASFAQGQAAMSFDGGWVQSTYANKEKSKIVDDLGFFILPNIDGGKGNDSVNASYCLFTQYSIYSCCRGTVDLCSL
ncbi:extracellular solute-binding protein [Paenibacillus larvae]|nr:extracellular solute-binding protein [Paenibacillus larvae]MCY7477819.1 extracellular solute-binding protein [Paenibacillus larvae]MCY7489634.1 extracellular solute-binding protein [Paenibacillus larvae]MCY9562465.1 extracellular solute-binding protein [Paenibacillus larvae]MCY9566214.1 extracellular solute-binding protein [Paenibacillus larvae]MCY9570739.1 extracellular solute-binding protein [Paenibacillus larvae]